MDGEKENPPFISGNQVVFDRIRQQFESSVSILTQLSDICWSKENTNMKNKQIFTVIVSLAFGFSIALIGCTRTEAQTIVQNPLLEAEEAIVYEQAQAPASRILIAYFSMPSENVNEVLPNADALTGASRIIVDGIMTGHLQHIANLIHAETGGDIFTIQTIQDYPARHRLLIDMARQERAENARPRLARRIINVQNYDTIFLGFPNWWSDMPMPLYSFLEEHDFAGKTIIPFVVHGGGRLPGAVDAIIQLQPQAAVVTDILSIHRNNLGTAENAVTAWLSSLEA